MFIILHERFEYIIAKFKIFRPSSRCDAAESLRFTGGLFFCLYSRFFNETDRPAISIIQSQSRTAYTKHNDIPRYTPRRVCASIIDVRNIMKGCIRRSKDMPYGVGLELNRLRLLTV